MSPPFDAISTEQLLALNDEIRSLARAGVPFERGLRVLGKDLPGRLGRLATRLSKQLERGESLVGALESNSESFPPLYCAVVAAGLRSGRLPAALESISTSVRQAAEVRRTMIVAMTYPLLLAAIGTMIFVFSALKTMPVIHQIFDSLNVERPEWYQQLTYATGVILNWLPWFWAAVVLVLIAWLIKSRRAARLGTSFMTWVPTIGAVRSAGRMATFSEVLATLVDQQIPLDEAVELAAAAGGGKELRQAGQMLAETLRGGGKSMETPPSGIPPLLTWMITASPRQPQLGRALRQSAAGYRQKAVRMSLLLGTYLPIFLSAFIGGAISLYYVVQSMGPFYYLLFKLGQP